MLSRSWDIYTSKWNKLWCLKDYRFLLTTSDVGNIDQLMTLCETWQPYIKIALSNYLMIPWWEPMWALCMGIKILFASCHIRVSLTLSCYALIYYCIISTLINGPNKICVKNYRCRNNVSSAIQSAEKPLKSSALCNSSEIR